MGFLSSLLSNFGVLLVVSAAVIFAMIFAIASFVFAIWVHPVAGFVWGLFLIALFMTATKGSGESA